MSLAMRTCAGCGLTHPQSELLRFMRRGDGAIVLVTDLRRFVGRSAYLCIQAQCVRDGLRKRSLLRTWRKVGKAWHGTAEELVSESIQALRESLEHFLQGEGGAVSKRAQLLTRQLEGLLSLPMATRCPQPGGIA